LKRERCFSVFSTLCFFQESAVVDFQKNANDVMMIICCCGGCDDGRFNITFFIFFTKEKKCRNFQGCQTLSKKTLDFYNQKTISCCAFLRFNQFSF
jgi:hypothetical protein